MQPAKNPPRPNSPTIPTEQALRFRFVSTGSQTIPLTSRRSSVASNFSHCHAGAQSEYWIHQFWHGVTPLGKGPPKAVVYHQLQN
jgi:hypothetical protein